MEVLVSILPFVVIFGVFWFFLIRPQQKKQKEHQAMVNNLQPGDNIITIGGIKGKIVKIKGDNIRLRVSSNVDIDVIKQSIGRMNPEFDKIEENKEEKEESAEN
ncbi:preprotein translocase subunit YajC [Halocella sp. SP3-1]|uniref:preprotein translocase subunit YajC n=1 Tax=Halocella sp. SP3-1 TaxID=2382161 RepID=UPI000F763D6C|nr:preprotein translocase subunit YajC [Halocella sp. SP3-1]AZO95043.1 preprotein translocase subunit YajC [Halocella sp. SP3-1]